MSTITDHARIAIIGAGPVGLATAIGLARAGVRPLVLDAKPAVAWTSRATCISRRSQEILDRIGAGRAFADKALGWSTGRTFHRDRLVFRLDMPHDAGDRHAPFVNLQQYWTEQFLVDALAAQTGPDTLRWDHRVTAVRPDADGVTLDIDTPDGARTLHADWLIAADGGRSVVREQLGLKLRGTAYESRYLIADIEIPGVARAVERLVWFDSPANPGSTVIVHIQPDHIWRIDCQLRDDEDADAALAEDAVRARITAQLAMMGVDAPWRLVWRSLYKALALSLDEYRHGRVLLAGDAAHLVPIFGVRGLNSGFDDAHNLAWKLAAVIRGDAPDALLDSYSAERRRATAENHAAAIKSTWFMSPPGPGFRLLRDAALHLAADHPWASALVNPRQSSAHIYDASPVIVHDDAIGAGIAPGAVLPNLRLADGTWLHDLLPRDGFAVLATTDGDTGDDAALRELGLAVIRLAAPDARLAAPGLAGYLVRPDEHVAALLPDLRAATVAAALDVATGRRPDASRAARPLADTTTPMESAFEAISRAVGDTPDATALLARLSLLMAEAIGDPTRVAALVDAARRA